MNKFYRITLALLLVVSMLGLTACGGGGGGSKEPTPRAISEMTGVRVSARTVIQNITAAAINTFFLRLDTFSTLYYSKIVCNISLFTVKDYFFRTSIPQPLSSHKVFTENAKKGTIK